MEARQTMTNGLGAADGGGTGGRPLPVAERERLFVLDALRGFAIFGVLVANVFSFAFPIWSAGVAAGSVGSGHAQVVRLLVAAFVEGKFYVLFSLLFGIGLALQSARAEATGRPLTGLYLRRLGILFLIGMLHGVLLYAIDILAFYAVLGLIALALHRLPTRTLLAVTLLLYLAALTAYGVYAVHHPEEPMPGNPEWRRLAEERHSELRDAGVPEPVIAGDARLRRYQLMDDELVIFQSGTWWQQTRYRAVAYLWYGWPLRLGITSWSVLALFLLGICLVRHRVLLDADQHPGRYAGLLVAGLLVGFLLHGAAFAVYRQGLHDLAASLVFLACMLAGGLLMALAYAAGVALLAITGWGRCLLRPVAAVGRLALTNYLAGSIVFGLVFYGYGLGLFGRVTVIQAYLVALALYAFQLIGSSLWLRWFRFGPFEWLWRLLTYGRLPPLRRSR
jgi:uncharacterized protein